MKKLTGKIAVIGAGPGGLSSAMLLASKGFDVTVFEKHDRVGGRNAVLNVGPTKFDTGPTLLVMKFVLDQLFKDVGRKSEDYLKFKRIEPMYRLTYSPDHYLDTWSQIHRDKMQTEFARVFPQEQNFNKWLDFEKIRFVKTMPLLELPVVGLKSLFNMDSVRALPYISLGRSYHGVLGDYFKDPLTKLSLSYQAKYLGMTPLEAPGFFNMIAFAEHFFGIYHTEGGMNEISNQMAKVVNEFGGKIRFNSPVKQLQLSGKKVTGLVLESGEVFEADKVVANADICSVFDKLIPNAEQVLHSWKPSKLPQKKYSCSAFMMYLSLNKVYDQVTHHNIVFSKDYLEGLNVISKGIIPEDPSLYVCNPAVTDNTMSPIGTSGLYILVPVPNMIKQSDAEDYWSKQENIEKMRQVVFKILKEKLHMNNVQDHIVAEKICTPTMWRDIKDVYQGAVFNLAHTIFQLLIWRPQNKFQELDNLFIAGGGTNPGSGLPTIYESARITTQLICKEYGIEWDRGTYANLIDLKKEGLR